MASYDDWKQTEPDDRDRDDRLIATCDTCGCQFRAEGDERDCGVCELFEVERARLARAERNDVIYRAAIKRWLAQIDPASGSVREP